MAMARPVVGARAGQVAEVVTSGENGLLYAPGHSEDLAARILEAEHRLYARAVRLVLEGRCRVEGRRVIVEGE